MAAGDTGGGEPGLEQALDLPTFLPGLPDRERLVALHDRCRRLWRAAVAARRRAAADAPILAVIVGGTNVGKSTVFNALCGADVSRASPLARGTKRPVCFAASRHEAALTAPGALGNYRVLPLADPEQALADPGGEALVHARWHDGREPFALVDTPDMDSTFLPNRTVSEDWLFLADVCCFVASAEKYHDAAGVRFLADAVRLGRTLVVVANKMDEEEALADLRARVLAAAAAPAETPVVPIAPLPAEKRTGGRWIAPVRAAIEHAATPAARERAGAGARAVFRAEFGEVLRAAAAQASAVRGLQAAAADLAVAEAEAFRRALEAERFYELERVYREVLAALRVPLLDDVYAAAGRFWRQIRRLLPGVTADLLGERIRARRQKERDAAKAALQRALDAREHLAERFGETLGPAARGLIPAPIAPEQLSTDLDRFLDEQDQVADAWVAKQRTEALEKLKAHPRRTGLLQALRTVLQVGPGVLAAFATGGVGGGLVTFAISERVSKHLLEEIGGRPYLQGLRRAYLDARAAALREFLHARVAAPVAPATPLPTVEAFRAAEAALAALPEVG